ncbi:MAG: 4-hydroxy-tetrahydrodipicolinate synthase [Candidatus Obscuribacterales bacterium]|nr:4-hydroxy-tetrahydrodipicolinate synthase [Candidatus Obscuribacterales bacterium]
MIGVDSPVFGKVVTAMVTPFKDDLSIDYKAVGSIVEHLINNGTSSIVVAGTTGESPTLEAEEKHVLLRAVVAAASGKAKVIAGAGSNSTAQTIENCKKAQEVGVDGLLIVAPYYNKPSQLGLLAHFETVMKSVKVPTMLYNIPGRTGVNISVETTIEIAKRCLQVHALKDSTGSVDQAGEIAGKIRADFRVYSGDDYLTLPFLSVGACGVVSVASHIVGNEILAMIDSFLVGDQAKARQIHYQYLQLFKGLFLAPNPACVKYVMSRLGLCQPYLRLPLVGPEKSQLETLDKLIADLKLLSTSVGVSQTMTASRPTR